MAPQVEGVDDDLSPQPPPDFTEIWISMSEAQHPHDGLGVGGEGGDGGGGGGGGGDGGGAWLQQHCSNH